MNIEEVARKGFMNLDGSDLRRSVQARNRAAMRRLTDDPAVNVEAITNNLQPGLHDGADQGAVRLANSIVLKGGHQDNDPSGLAICVKRDGDHQEGEGEPDEKTDLDSKMPRYHAAFEKKYPGNARAKMRALAADRDSWEKDEEPERKALEAYCEDDNNFLDKSTNTKVYGSRPNSTTKVFG